MRLDCKQLRYTLELNQTRRSRKILNVLKSWQDAQGSIHHSDMTIDKLRKYENSTEIKAAMENETRQRNAGYRNFQRDCAKDTYLPIDKFEA